MLHEIGQPRLVVYRESGLAEISVAKNSGEIGDLANDIQVSRFFRFVPEMGAYVNTHFLIRSNGKTIATMIVYV
jgi:hypothetical protein